LFLDFLTHVCKPGLADGVPVITVGSEKMMGFDAGRFMALWKNTQGKQ
jgi:hypothetical protein